MLACLHASPQRLIAAAMHVNKQASRVAVSLVVEKKWGETGTANNRDSTGDSPGSFLKRRAVGLTSIITVAPKNSTIRVFLYDTTRSLDIRYYCVLRPILSYYDSRLAEFCQSERIELKTYFSSRMNLVLKLESAIISYISNPSTRLRSTGIRIIWRWR